LESACQDEDPPRVLEGMNTNHKPPALFPGMTRADVLKSDKVTRLLVMGLIAEQPLILEVASVRIFLASFKRRFDAALRALCDAAAATDAGVVKATAGRRGLFCFDDELRWLARVGCRTAADDEAVSLFDKLLAARGELASRSEEAARDFELHAAWLAHQVRTNGVLRTSPPWRRGRAPHTGVGGTP
jgi:hypothetical protein